MSDIFKTKISNIISIIFAINLFLITGTTGCNGDKPTINEEPEVYDLVAPDSLIKGLPDTTAIYLSVRDPQGLEDIDSVFFTVNRPDGSTNGFTFYMFDDGENGGDAVAADGIYSQGIQSPDLTAQTGDYVFHFSARDMSGNISNTIDKSITAYESDNPVIKSTVINQYDALNQHLYLAAYTLDPQGRPDLDRVWVEITFLDQDTLLGEFDLDDWGNNGDSAAFDNIFSLDYESQSDSGFAAGNYQIEFNAIDLEGNFAQPVDTIFAIDPPVLLKRF